ncbi:MULTISPECIES: hypothetical protein [Crocosphaera]|uniref:Uncharacterized protein n=1 Tax=Crocosphaera watsonii WH 0005 TaxID=423472 RepID=T2J1S6_CROWT|nr:MULTISPECIES: hypothetical protein [Crocosphaera]MCH2247670.1 hypothetical protein [Crocosphaera sp.]CCQ58335.1 hypothetical protein CWATWH0005_1219 [Crocosphaera watsonii WH 0005]
MSEYPHETVPEAITSGAKKQNGNEYEEGEGSLLSLMQVMVDSYWQQQRRSERRNLKYLNVPWYKDYR